MISFYTYLTTRKDEDSPIGDLAKDVMADARAPRRINNHDAWLLHLLRMNAAPAAIAAFEEAWKKYHEHP